MFRKSIVLLALVASLAGFVRGFKCSGRSETLGVDSRPELDTELLELEA